MSYPAPECPPDRPRSRRKESLIRRVTRGAGGARDQLVMHERRGKEEPKRIGTVPIKIPIPMQTTVCPNRSSDLPRSVASLRAVLPYLSLPHSDLFTRCSFYGHGLYGNWNILLRSEGLDKSRRGTYTAITAQLL